MSTFYHCPICWSGKKTCKCTKKDWNQYYSSIQKDKDKYWNKERKKFHNILDESLQRYRKESQDFNYGTFPQYLIRQILNLLNKEEYKKLRKEFDGFFKV